MGILSFYPGIENLGSSIGFLPPFVTKNHDTFLSLELVGKPCLTTYVVSSRDGVGDDGIICCFVYIKKQVKILSC